MSAGQFGLPPGMLRVLADVANERDRQDGKFGRQDHDPNQWLGILGEEYGEVCREVNKIEWPRYNESCPDPLRLRAELVQVAAVAVAWVECIDRDSATPKGPPMPIQYFGPRSDPDPTWPRAVPWALVAPHEERAKRNHCGQGLRRLAERGGLSPQELVAVLFDRDWSQVVKMSQNEAVRLIQEALAAHQKGGNGQ